MLRHVQFETLRCSLDTNGRRQIGNLSEIQGRGSENLRFISLLMVLKVIKLHVIMEGISVDREEERSKDWILQHFQVSKAPKEMEKEKPENLEEKQTRMVP